MLQWGIHFFTLYDHIFFRNKEPKFFELLFHHAMSVFLISFSYMGNLVPVGIMTLFTHDPGDVLLDISRVFNDWHPRPSNLLDISYVLFVISWMFLRLGVFPGCVVKAAVDYTISSGSHATLSEFQSLPAYLSAMLVGLIFLHLYWFWFVIRILIRVLAKKGDPNEYDNNKKE